MPFVGKCSLVPACDMDDLPFSETDAPKRWSRAADRGKSVVSVGASMLGFRLNPQSAGIAGAIIGAFASLLFAESAGRPIFDSWQRIAPREISADEVAVVLIDDLSLETVASWPWPRLRMAQLTDAIASQGPKAIGFDMIFPQPDPQSVDALFFTYPEIGNETAAKLKRMPSGDDKFSSILRITPTILGRLGVPSGYDPDDMLYSSKIVGDPPQDTQKFPKVLTSIPLLDDAALGHASINGEPDADGIVRRVPLTVMIGRKQTPGLALELSRVVRGSTEVKWRHLNLEVGDALLPADRSGTIALRFGQFPSSATFSAANVLAGRVPTGSFSGKAVLIAMGAEGTSDIVASPLTTGQFGVFVQAQGVDALLHRGWLSRPQWVQLVEALLSLSLILLVWTSARTAHRWPGFTAIGVLFALPAISFLMLDRWNLLFNPVTPLATGVVGLLAMELVRSLERERARKRIHLAFDKYLSPELVNRIARDPSRLELGGEERDMTVMFCDVRGFSALSEKLSPQEVIRFLIGLLTPMTDILLAGRGTIDKYIGDAIVAFWNAPVDDPVHASNAADAALAMIARLRELNIEMPDQDEYPWPGEVRIGIGLNSGLVCVGNMGSERRLSYSMIGDTVNLASRIEGLTKFYGIEIAIGENLSRRLSDYAQLELDKVRVIGRQQPERVFALFGGPDLKASDDFRSLRDGWTTFLALYRSQRWADARAALAEVDAEHTWSLARLKSIYVDRLEQLETASSIDVWDGVYVAREK